MRGIEEHDGDPGDTEPGRVPAVLSEQAREVRGHAGRAAWPEPARLVVRGEDQAGGARLAKHGGETECLLALAPPPGHGKAVDPRVASLGKLDANPRGVTTVVGPRLGIVSRSDIEPATAGEAPRIVESDDALVRHLEAGVIPVAPAAGRALGRPVPRVVDGEDEASPDSGGCHRLGWL